MFGIFKEDRFFIGYFFFYENISSYIRRLF